MRAFWERESDTLIGSVLSELLDLYEAIGNRDRSKLDTVSLAKGREMLPDFPARVPLDDPSQLRNS